MDEWLKVGELADMFRVSVKTATRWCAEGKIPGVIKTPGNQYRIPRAEAEKIARRPQ